MKVKHLIDISDAFGNLLAVNVKYFSGTYVRAENAVGSLSITLPGNFPAEFLKWHGRITIWRIVDTLAPALAEGTVWLINKISRITNGVDRYWEIEASCANSILAGRIVDYNQNNAYTLKLDNADDMGKALVRENFGSLATDATRNISTYLTVEADLAAGPTLKLAFENRRVLDILQDLANASLKYGTYLVFDVTMENGVFVFRSYTQQRGGDHRFPSGAAGPLVIGPDFGNFSNASVSLDYSGAWTRGIVSGESVAGIYAKSRQDNTDMQALSPFGLIEEYQASQNQVADSTLLDTEASALMQAGNAKVKVSGSLNNTPYFIYGVHWGWGDYITVQVDGANYDMHVEKVQVPLGMEPSADQSVEVIMRSE